MTKYFSPGIRRDMRKAQEKLREEKSLLGIHSLFRSEVYDYSENEFAYKVRFMQGDEVLERDSIPRRYLDDVKPKDSSFLRDLLRRIELIAKQHKSRSENR